MQDSVPRKVPAAYRPAVGKGAGGSAGPSPRQVPGRIRSPGDLMFYSLFTPWIFTSSRASGVSSSSVGIEPSTFSTSQSM